LCVVALCAESSAELIFVQFSKDIENARMKARGYHRAAKEAILFLNPGLARRRPRHRLWLVSAEKDRKQITSFTLERFITPEARKLLPKIFPRISSPRSQVVSTQGNPLRNPGAKFPQAAPADFFLPWPISCIVNANRNEN
jgi:hypothetical protein